MPFVSITRLRIRSIRFLPLFAFHAIRSNNQVARASGFNTGALLNDRHWTFWTMTLWDSHEDMRRYMLEGSHREAMPHLMHWCDEASVVHWDRPETTLPTWPEADRRMRDTGRASKVKFPAPTHADLTFAAPRVTGSNPIVRRPS